ncbi:nuclear transport factor 2 family protein [Ilyomonas limi]|uniref:Nuclear transport factor 2 family protein n=1 Tax=Ilyomonas limi TaxID=2575867 RepID=A0A4U3KZ45_9BACT|nr:nuclear transport factor 2 family protein [Ilyomonas limi]TKK67790.1 nuclear transport factor 2 family protein [Ilyomonas limi]
MIRSATTLLLMAVVFCIQTAHAQTTEDAIKQAINQLFTAMKNADSVSLVSCFADSAVLQTIVDNEGKISVHNEQVTGFASSIAKLQKGDADEQVTFNVIKADGELAIVWAPYKFYWKGKFSHCGIDSFQLIRIDGVWKIQYLIDTRRKEACE